MTQNLFYCFNSYASYLFYSLLLLFPNKIDNQKNGYVNNISKNVTISQKIPLRDSIRKFVVEPNEKKIEALGNYVFKDSKNLYKYPKKNMILANLSPINDTKAKLKVLANVRKYGKGEESIKIVTRKDRAYLQWYYSDEITLDINKNVVLIDLNSDNIKELLCWSGFTGNEHSGSILGLWAFDTKKQAYFLTHCFGGVDAIEKFTIDSITKKVDLQYFTYGCCADYSRKQTKYTITYQNDKFKVKEIGSKIFNEEYYLFPKKLQTPKKVTLDYESFIYSKPLVRDSKVLIENSDAYGSNITGLTLYYTYCIGKIPAGTKVTILSTYTNSKKETWQFALLEKGYKPKELILFQLCDKNSQIYVWLPPKGYTNE